MDSIAWQAAYERYTREGNSEDKAIAMADQVVIDTQSSSNVSDLSAIERSQGARLFTVFYSWMNAALNMGVVEAMGENDRAKAVARLLFMGAVMPVLESLFREALQAHDSDDDDDEDWTKQWLRKPLGAVVEYHLGLFLGLREVSSTAKSLWLGGYLRFAVHGLQPFSRNSLRSERRRRRQRAGERALRVQEELAAADEPAKGIPEEQQKPRGGDKVIYLFAAGEPTDQPADKGGGGKKEQGYGDRLRINRIA